MTTAPRIVPFSEAHNQQADALGAFDLGYSFGHATYNLRDGEPNGARWRYSDTHALVAESPPRPCAKCSLPPRPDGIDPCLGRLPGVWSACCGHGCDERAWMVFNDYTEIRGQRETQPRPLLAVILKLRAERAPKARASILERRAIASLKGRGWTTERIEAALASQAAS